MEQISSWDSNRRLLSQKNPHLLWKPMIRHGIHNSPSLETILSHMDPVHNLQTYVSKHNFDIILPSMPRSSEQSLPYGYSYENFVCISDLSHT